MAKKLTIPEDEIMWPGHMGCLGCGATLAMRYALKALGRRTIISIPACCWAVMPGVWPYNNLQIPMLYTAFETTGASISGLRAGLDARGKQDINVVGWAGDGGTVDIGIQALSGAVERGHNVIYICYDNEAYMNTGIQRSGSTPIGAWTTTTQVGTTQDWKKEPKKNMVEIMAAHRIPYTATASVGYPEDFIKKIQKALTIKGPKYLQVYAPCPTGWRAPPEKTMELARMVVKTCIFPLIEIENGVKYTISRKPAKKEPINEYYGMQGRFRHLPADVLEEIQADIDKEWALLLKREEFSKDL
jgi:pyruvate/2-oxoacid:ferredoxin oxidoreductase beta subunit